MLCSTLSRVRVHTLHAAYTRTAIPRRHRRPNSVLSSFNSAPENQTALTWMSEAQGDPALLVPEFISTENKPYVEALLQHAARMKRGKDEDPVCMSDLVSAEGPDGQLQYVHLVLAAAGMLGIAYVGFVWMLEAAGIRFLGLGGCSAGAITAGTIASSRNRPDKPCSQKVLKALGDADFSKLWGASKGMRKCLAKEKLSLCDMACLAWAVCKNLGLSPYTKLQEWLRKNERSDSRTWGQLLDKMCLKNHPADNGQGTVDVKVYNVADHMDDVTDKVDAEMRKPENYPLRLVSTELTTQNMVVLPRDAHLFYKDQQSAGPSDFVLASSTIPVYFMPFKHVLPQDIGLEATQALWKTELLFDGPLPESVVFTDGAILSNLPFNLFHSSPGPQLAKIGVMVTMGRERDAPLKIDCLQSYVKALSSTTRLLNDRSYQHDNPIYDDCIVSIVASDFRQLDFDMTQQQKEKLLIRGMEAGRRFLEKWRETKGCWETFKARHAQLEKARACGSSATPSPTAAPPAPAEAAAAAGW